MKNKNTYSSIKFTKRHHNEISELFNYENLSEKDYKQSLNNLEKHLSDNDAPRYLYVIRCIGTNFYKIGITNNLNKRLKTHQTGCPLKLKYIFAVEADIEDFLGREITYLEKFLHNNYASHKIHGEWFCLTYSHLADLCFFFEESRDFDIIDETPKELSLFRKKVNEIISNEQV